MSDISRESEIKSSKRVVYVLPADDVVLARYDQMNLATLMGVLSDGKKLIIIVTTILVFLTAIYSLIATQWYRADVLVILAGEKSTGGLSEQLGAFGGIAQLAGLRVGDSDDTEALAVLRSRNFIRKFIDAEGLWSVLEEERVWLKFDQIAEQDSRDTVRFFRENILRVIKDKKTGLITVGVEWTDPEIAAEWANLLVDRLNNQMRQRSLRQAESSIGFLKNEMAIANVVALQQSVARLLESEMQNAMLARVSDEFAFRVVDRAEAPNRRSWPKRTQLVLIAGILGLFVSSMGIVVRHSVHSANN